MNEVDYSRYPARETQLQWLRYYLQAQKGTAVTPREVERLYVQVNKFALVSAGGWKGAGREELAGGLTPSSCPLTALWSEEAEPRVRAEVQGVPALRRSLGRAILDFIILRCPLLCFPPIPSSAGSLSFLENYFQEDPHFLF